MKWPCAPRWIVGIEEKQKEKGVGDGNYEFPCSFSVSVADPTLTSQKLY